ncbi:MAG: hypothetical protein ACYDDS_08160 [Candidatus Sulfotelmatobacter sp.]
MAKPEGAVGFGGLALVGVDSILLAVKIVSQWRTAMSVWPLLTNPIILAALMILGLLFIWVAASIEHQSATTMVKLSGIKWSEAFRNKWAERALITVLVVMPFTAGITYYVMQWKPPVYAPFRDTYKEYESPLGKPLSYETAIAHGAYQGTFRHATVIWISRPLKFYVLSDDGTWHEEWERSFPPVPYPEPPWYADDDLKRMFQPPSGSIPPAGPPSGSAAYHWWKDPTHWEKMLGWREWECTFKDDAIRYQDFAHGRVIGTFRFRPTTDEAELFILLNDHTWKSGYSSAKAEIEQCKP